MTLSKVTRGPRVQGVPISGSLQVQYQSRYVDAAGRATQGEYTASWDNASSSWKDALTGSDFYIITAGVADPVPPSVMFVETFKYANGKTRSQVWETKPVVNSSGTDFDYAASPTNASFVQTAPLSLQTIEAATAAALAVIAGGLLPATDSVAGKVKFATNDTTISGLADSDATHPAGVAAAIRADRKSLTVDLREWLTRAQKTELASGLSVGYDYRNAVQLALNEAPIGSTIIMPSCGVDLPMAWTSGDPWLLHVTRFVNIKGGGRGSRFRADIPSGNLTVDLLKYDVSAAGGSGDVRGMKIENLQAYFNGGGRDCVTLTQSLPLLDFEITGSNLSGFGINGRAIRTQGEVAFSKFSGNPWLGGGIEMLQCGDGQRIWGNNINSIRKGIVMDIIFGSLSHSILSNVIVTRDGALHVINGSQLSVHYNQMELSEANQSTDKSMIYVEGVSAQSEGIVISENNFGGEAYTETNVYLSNARETTVEDNTFKEATTWDVRLGANSSDNTIGENRYYGTRAYAAGDKNVKPRFQDLGTGNKGVRNFSLALSNGWVNSLSSYYKDDQNRVHLDVYVQAGPTTDNTVVLTMPPGFRPKPGRRFAVSTFLGPATIKADANGVFKTAAPLTDPNLYIQISYLADS
jgi:hypothetical protein